MLTEVEAAVFGLERLRAAAMKGDKFEPFVSNWGTAITGTKKKKKKQPGTRCWGPSS